MKLTTSGFVLCCLIITFAFCAVGAPEDKADVGVAAEAAILPVSPVPAQTEAPSKRLFGVIPNYRADQFDPNYKPLTTAEKFKIARGDSFDWPNYFLIAGYAIQSQVASGGFSHTGGIKTFGEFYGRSVADQVVGAYITEAILPSLLHEDPRFFRLGEGKFWHRVTHAATCGIVIARRDDGSYGFAFSEIVGNMAAVAGTSFYHSEAQTAGEATERFSMNIGNDVISNMITEFWPDVKHHLPMFHHPK